MGLSYDTFTAAFLSKISEYEFISMEEVNRTAVVDGYLKRALTEFKKNCKYDFTSTANDKKRKFLIDVAPEDLDELVNIISEGMLIQWMKPYVYKQENLENILNTNVFGLRAI